MKKLTHFDDAGAARMVDVGQKAESERVAVAAGAVEMEPAALAGSKRTAELIPLCHPVRVTAVDVALTAADDGGRPRVEIVATVQAFDRTGVEMEALTAVTLAGLTIYDMCKAIDRGMRLGDVRL